MMALPAGDLGRARLLVYVHFPYLAAGCGQFQIGRAYPVVVHAKVCVGKGGGYHAHVRLQQCGIAPSAHRKGVMAGSTMRTNTFGIVPAWWASPCEGRVGHDGAPARL